MFCINSRVEQRKAQNQLERESFYKKLFSLHFTRNLNIDPFEAADERMSWYELWKISTA